MELLDVKNVRRDDQISRLHTYIEAEIAAKEKNLGRQLSDNQRRMYYKPFGIRPGRSILEGVNFDPVFQVFRDPCHLWQGGLIKVLSILGECASQEYISVLSKLLTPKKKEMYLIYDITSTLSLEKRIKAIPWPRRTPHILPLVKMETDLFSLVKQQIFKDIWCWLQPVTVADAGTINRDSVPWSLPEGDIRPLPTM